MKLELIRWELKKLWSMPIIPVFLVLCILLNGLVLFTQEYGTDYVSYVAEVTEQIGGTMGEEFDRRLDLEPEHAYKSALVNATHDAADVYDIFSTHSILEIMLSVSSSSEWVQQLWEKKYQALQKVVGLMAEEDVSMSLYAGEMSDRLTNLLFGVLFRMMITEGWITAVLMALYLTGSEAFDRTALSVYSTRTGRRIQGTKYIAAAISGVLAYSLLLVVGLGLFSLLWDMGPLWSASISSQMNYRYLGVHLIPYLTWKPMTVGDYLMATAALGAVCVLIYQTIAFAVGMVCRDALQAFFVLMGTGITLYALVPFTSGRNLWEAFVVLEWNPVMLWVTQYKWFTDMDYDSIVPWQECKVALLGIILAIVLLWWSYRIFRRKDVA